MAALSIGNAPRRTLWVSTGTTNRIARFDRPVPSRPRSVREEPGCADTAIVGAPVAASLRCRACVKSRFACLLSK